MHRTFFSIIYAAISMIEQFWTISTFESSLRFFGNLKKPEKPWHFWATYCFNKIFTFLPKGAVSKHGFLHIFSFQE